MTREEFITLVKREQGALRGFLLALCCGNRDDADDLAQDALVKAYLTISGYQDQGRFRSWLFRIAFNTFLNHRASGHDADSIDDPEAAIGQEATALTSSDGADSGFEHQDLYLALRTLPPKERSAITLFYLNGYSIKEIASITSDSEDAIKKQLSRGRDKLKQRLKI